MKMLISLMVFGLCFVSPTLLAQDTFHAEGQRQEYLAQKDSLVSILPQVTNSELALGTGLKSFKSSSFKLGMRLLFLSATRDEEFETTISLVKTVFSSFAIPYDHIVLTELESDLELFDDVGNPKYYGIILATNDLAYKNAAGEFSSALSVDQRSLIEQYMVNYGVRLMSMYSYPGKRMGVNLVKAHNTTMANTILTTDFFKSFDPSTKRWLKFPISKHWHYSATKMTTGAIKVAPFLVYNNVSLAASVSTFPDGREELHFYFTQSKYTRASLITSAAWVSWVTKGLYQGKRRAYLNTQVNDVFMSTDLWDVNLNKVVPGKNAYRITAADLTYLNQWQKVGLRKETSNSEFKVELAFNSQELLKNQKTSSDALYLKAKTMQQDFNWVAQTYAHAEQNVNTINWEYPIVTTSVLDLLGSDESLNFSRNTLVNPGVDKLLNASALEGLKENKIENLFGPIAGRENDSEGLNTTLEQHGFEGLFALFPKSTVVYYNVSLPSQLTSEYNFLYKKYFGRVSTFAEILKRESERVATDLLNYNIVPYSFHQASLRSYVIGEVRNSLYSAWMKTMIAELRKYHTLPILSLKADQIALELKNRRDAKSCEVQSYVHVVSGSYKSVEVLNPNFCQVVLTATNSTFEFPKVELYGPDKTIYLEDNQAEIPLK